MSTVKVAKSLSSRVSNVRYSMFRTARQEKYTEVTCFSAHAQLQPCLSGSTESTHLAAKVTEACKGGGVMAWSFNPFVLSVAALLLTSQVE